MFKYCKDIRKLNVFYHLLFYACFSHICMLHGSTRDACSFMVNYYIQGAHIFNLLLITIPFPFIIIIRLVLISHWLPDKSISLFHWCAYLSLTNRHVFLVFSKTSHPCIIKKPQRARKLTIYLKYFMLYNALKTVFNYIWCVDALIMYLKFALEKWLFGA